MPTDTLTFTSDGTVAQKGRFRALVAGALGPFLTGDDVDFATGGTLALSCNGAAAEPSQLAMGVTGIESRSRLDQPVELAIHQAFEIGFDLALELGRRLSANPMADISDCVEVARDEVWRYEQSERKESQRMAMSQANRAKEIVTT
jgi:hypothetical protein